MRNLHLLLLITVFTMVSAVSSAQQKTYCNPVNIDYGYTPIPNFSQWGKHRATADPVIVNYKGVYFLFSTNQWGYWWSEDLVAWNFISRRFLRPWNEGYDELCAPAVGIIGDTMLVFGSTYTGGFTIWMSTNPKTDDWYPLVDSFAIGGWDPAFFTDDDGRFYMYNGSSNRYPLYGVESGSTKRCSRRLPARKCTCSNRGVMAGSVLANIWTTLFSIPLSKGPG